MSNDGLNITAYPTDDLTNETLEHLHLNIVKSLALSCQSKLILHGSAVCIDTTAVAFIAKTGSGKSTLAASFSTNGYKFLTDDCLQVDKVNSQYFVQPSHPSIRLWDDSLSKLIPENISTTTPPDFSPKTRLLANEGIEYCNKAQPLKAIYFLDDGDSPSISINPVRGSNSIVELEKHSFLLDMENREILKKHFQQISDLAKDVNCFYLKYPRQYDSLPEVQRAIIEHTQLQT